VSRRLGHEGWSQQRVARRVALLVGAGVVSATLVAGWLAMRAVRDLSESLQSERQALAALAAARFSDAIEALQATLSGVSSQPHFDLGDADPEPEQTALHGVLVRSSRRLERVVLLGQNDQVLAAAPAGAEPQGCPAGASGLSPDARPIVSDLLQTADGPRVILAVPVSDWRGRRTGLLCATADPRSPPWRQLLEPAPSEAGASLDLLDGAGGLVVSSDGARSSALRDPDDLVAAAPVSAAPGYRVLVRQPRELALAPALALRRRLLLTGPALLALALLFAFGAGRSVTQPLRVLGDAAARIASGDLSAPVPYVGEDEVGRLGGGLERMRSALQASLDEVRRANEELEARVEARTHDLARLYDELEQRDRIRQRLIHKLISAQEDERRRMARELHDDTCQMLAAIAVGVDAALRSPEPAVAAHTLGETKAVVSRALAGIHELIYDLRPSVLDDLGLLPAIRWLAARHLEPRGVAVRTELEAPLRAVPPELEIAVFRVVQEALQNVARHAGAESVLIQLEERDGRLVVEVEDDGRGFDAASVATPGPDGRGLGLMGMRERVELLGGELKIDSEPGVGTHLTLSLPLPGEEQR
jgi:signal transduction histidine kinase